MREKDYVGVKPCGHVVAWVSVTLNDRGELANILAEWIRDGLSVERRTTAEAREQLHVCTCDVAPVEADQLEAFPA